MPVLKGTVFKCGECRGPRHTRAGCPRVLAELYPVGSIVGEYSTVLALIERAVVLRCRCGVEFQRGAWEIKRDEREGYRVTCGAGRCRCARRTWS